MCGQVILAVLLSFSEKLGVIIASDPDAIKDSTCEEMYGKHWINVHFY